MRQRVAGGEGHFIDAQLRGIHQVGGVGNALFLDARADFAIGLLPKQLREIFVGKVQRIRDAADAERGLRVVLIDVVFHRLHDVRVSRVRVLVLLAGAQTKRADFREEGVEPPGILHHGIQHALQAVQELSLIHISTSARSPMGRMVKPAIKTLLSRFLAKTKNAA